MLPMLTHAGLLPSSTRKPCRKTARPGHARSAVGSKGLTEGEHNKGGHGASAESAYQSRRVGMFLDMAPAVFLELRQRLGHRDRAGGGWRLHLAALAG